MAPSTVAKWAELVKELSALFQDIELHVASFGEQIYAQTGLVANLSVDFSEARRLLSANPHEESPFPREAVVWFELVTELSVLFSRINSSVERFGPEIYNRAHTHQLVGHWSDDFSQARRLLSSTDGEERGRALSNGVNWPERVGDLSALFQDIERLLAPVGFDIYDRERADQLVKHFSADFSKARDLLSTTAGEEGPSPGEPDNWPKRSAELSVLFAGIARLLERFGTDIYELDHAALSAALAPSRSWRSLLAGLFSADYRFARDAVRALLRDPQKISASQALTAIEEAARHRREWQRLDAAQALNAIERAAHHRSEWERLEASQALDALEEAARHREEWQRLDAAQALNAIEQAADHRSEWERLGASQVLDAVEEAASHWLEWERLGANGNPRVLEGFGDVRKAVNLLIRRLATLQNLLSCTDLAREPYGEVEQKLRRMTSQQNVAANLPHIQMLEREFKNAGIGKFTAAVGEEISSEHAAHAFEYAWLHTIWDERLFDDSNLAGFTSSLHDRREGAFAGLDLHHLEITPQRIKRAAAAAAILVMNDYPVETSLVKAQAVKKRRHLPVRRLFEQAPHVLTAIRPCWTMSPLLVAETIPANMDLFDVVIFDEASQIPPAEAAGSLTRAPQAVIAGDDRQLPPTSFFAKQVIDEEDEDGDDDLNTALIDDIESILDVVKAGPLREEMLRWHYRSRDARLIAFSNANLYGEALTTFPGANLDGPISHHLVPSRPLPQRSTRSHPDEVAKVVELVIGHARDHPGESLGVIAFGIHHARQHRRDAAQTPPRDQRPIAGRVLLRERRGAVLRQEYRARAGR